MKAVNLLFLKLLNFFLYDTHIQTGEVQYKKHRIAIIMHKRESNMQKISLSNFWRALKTL